MFRDTGNVKNLAGEAGNEEKLQRQQTMLKVFEILLDIANKDVKPIQLIKETGPQFILPLY